MSWIEGNFRGLDLRNDVEWGVVGADAEGDGQLATAIEGMDGKGCGRSQDGQEAGAVVDSDDGLGIAAD